MHRTGEYLLALWPEIQKASTGGTRIRDPLVPADGSVENRLAADRPAEQIHWPQVDVRQRVVHDSY